MNIIEFLNTVYLGDRGCKSILIDGWNSEVKVQVTCISRVRSDNWNYHTVEDLPDGFLVFEGVDSFTLDPSGLVPNDVINGIHAEPLADDSSKYNVVMSIDSVDEIGNHKEVLVRIVAVSMALEDHFKPGERITR